MLKNYALVVVVVKVAIVNASVAILYCINFNKSFLMLIKSLHFLSDKILNLEFL